MVTALIFAGGVGLRMNSKARPKQFLELHGKPVLLYTVEHFEDHPSVDNILIVCLKEWIPELKRQLRRNSIQKVKWIVPGGETVSESIYNGLKTLVDNECDPESIVLIHDGVRPLINKELITQNIETARKFGNAITVDYARETIVTMNADRIENIPPREIMWVAKAPQTFCLKDVWDGYRQSRDKNLLFIDSAQLMNHYGYELRTVIGPEYNIKITTPTDYYLFRALYEARENSQIFGL